MHASMRPPAGTRHDASSCSAYGHLTEAMQEHYSTVAPNEQREALARVFDLAGVRRAKERAQADEGTQGTGG